MNLNDNRMWRAVITNDPGYDGVFYYGVKSTGVFCRPSCQSKVPKRENVQFFSNRDEALREGFRPCKRCRPDSPDVYRGPIREMADRIFDLLQKDYANPRILYELPGLVGVSPFHLIHSFKKVVGITPSELLREIRVHKAEELIKSSELNNTEVCYQVGFQSLSNFYEAFRKKTGKSPGEYRKTWEAVHIGL